jgi:hypothetical protein
MTQRPINYLHKRAPQGGQHAKSRVAVRSLPDPTIHQPPGAMFAIGGLGILAGGATNLWQMVTTFTAFWSLFNPAGTPVTLAKQPVVFIICALIAFSFQFALIMLVFRIDTVWKKYRVNGQAQGSLKGHAQARLAQAKSTAVEIVQHVNLVMVWGALGFVIDTIGDYTFIGLYTAALPLVTATFIIFCYAVALYALSTVAFARSIEYVWAGFAATDNLREQRMRQQQNQNGQH